MKRFTFLFTSLLLLMALTVKAQIMPSVDVFKKHTQTGTISEVKPFNTGFIYLSNDGTNDIVSYTEDGITFVEIETLESGSSKVLRGWKNSSEAFYLGNNVTDNVGVELRQFNGTSASFINEHNPLKDPNIKVISGAERHFNGTNYEYHYLFQADYDDLTGAIVTHNIYDGEYVDEIVPENLLVAGDTYNNGNLHGTSFNGSYYYGANSPGGWSGYPALFQVNNGAIDFIFEEQTENLAVYDLNATTSNLYFLVGVYGDASPANLFINDVNNNVSRMMQGGADLFIEDRAGMQVLNDKLYAVSTTGDVTKLVEIDGQTITTFHINAEDVSDNITEMVVSGDYVFVLATGADGTAQLYTINPSLAEPKFVKSSAIWGPEPKFLTAIEGGVAFVHDQENNDVIYISDGFTGNTRSLGIENFSSLVINSLIATDAGLYAFVTNGDDTDIYEYAIAPFSTKDVTITVQDPVNGGVGVSDAALVIDAGLEYYEAITNVDGEIVITMPYGGYDVLISKDGHNTIESNFYVGAWSTDPVFEMSSVKGFTYTILEATGGGDVALENVKIMLSEPTTGFSYSVTTDATGMAAFTDVYYGTYDYTISLYGYEDVIGQFVVNDDTVDPDDVYMTALSSMTFDVTVLDNAVGVEGASINIVANSIYTFDATTDANGIGNFTDVFYGEYTYTIIAPGYYTATDVFQVDAGINTGLEVTLTPIETAAFDFNIFELVNNVDIPMEGALIELVDDSGTNTANTTYEYSATTDANGTGSFTDVYYGEYDYTITLDGYITVEGTITVNVDAEGTTTVEYLMPGATVSFEVYDSSIGDETSGGELTYCYFNLVNEESVTINGSYGNSGATRDFVEIPYGTYTYKITKYGFAAYEGEIVVDGNSPALIRIGLLPAKDCDFTIKDANDALLEGVAISITDGTNTYSGVTSEYGTAFIEDMLYNTYTLTISLEGYVTISQSFIVDESTQYSQNFTLQSVATNIGSVEANKVSIYPNPTIDVVNISSSVNIVAVDVYALNGAKQISRVGEDITQVNISQLSRGLYLIATTDRDGNRQITKINKN